MSIIESQDFFHLGNLYRFEYETMKEYKGVVFTIIGFVNILGAKFELCFEDHKQARKLINSINHENCTFEDIYKTYDDIKV